MNKWIGMGRLVRDPEIKDTSAGKVARFTLAIDRRGEGADFINCVAFNKAAEFQERFCKKGTKLVVEGRIQTGSYSKQDGTKVYTTDIIVESTEFAESKSSAAQNSGKQDNKSGGDGFMNVPAGIEEELPFN